MLVLNTNQSINQSCDNKNIISVLQVPLKKHALAAEFTLYRYAALLFLNLFSSHE
jgi:hypothetical protein